MSTPNKNRDESMTCVPLNATGKLANTPPADHWSTKLSKAMEDLALAQATHHKSTAELARAAAAFERAKTDAENSILGNE